MDCSLPGSSLHGILQARALEWVAIALASLVAQPVKALPTMWETRVRSLGGEDPWRRKWQPTPVLLPGKSHGWRSLIGYRPWGRKESDTTEQLHFTSTSGLALAYIVLLQKWLMICFCSEISKLKLKPSYCWWDAVLSIHNSLEINIYKNHLNVEKKNSSSCN